MKRICDNCGAENEQNNRYCSSCGAELPDISYSGASDWYYMKGSERVGPMSETVLPQLIRSREITKDTMVWRTGLDNWIRADETEINELFSLIPVESSSVPVIASSDELSDKWLWALAMVQFLSIMFLNRLGFLGTVIIVILNCIFITLDEKELKKNGYEPQKWLWLGVVLVPLYLFVRAAKTNRKWGPGILWCVLFVVSALVSSCSASSTKQDTQTTIVQEETAVVTEAALIEETPEIEYIEYNLADIQSDIASNSLRREAYANQGMILRGIVKSITNDNIKLNPVDDSDMEIDISAENFTQEALMSLSNGDIIQVTGICTSISSLRIYINAVAIEMIKTADEIRQENDVLAAQRLEEARILFEETGPVTMEQLYEEAKANPIAFSNYEGQYLMVEGEIRNINEYSGFTVSDSGHNCDIECGCHEGDDLYNQVSEFSIGQRVVIIGQVENIINASNDVGFDPATQIVEGFIDGMMGISIDGFNMYFDCYSVESAG